MGCFKKPKKIKAGKQETMLAGIAREQYEKYKQNIVPLENVEIADALQTNSPGQKQRSEERSVNAAREQFSEQGVVARPDGAGNNVLQLNMAKARSTAKASAGGKNINRARNLQRRTNIVSLGRGISTSASGAMNRSASFENGIDYAETSGNNAIANAQLQLAGQVVGAGTMLYGNKKGWFDKKDSTKTYAPPPKSSSTGGY